jgi:hypothetical protein
MTGLLHDYLVQQAQAAGFTDRRFGTQLRRRWVRGCYTNEPIIDRDLWADAVEEYKRSRPRSVPDAFRIVKDWSGREFFQCVEAEVSHPVSYDKLIAYGDLWFTLDSEWSEDFNVELELWLVGQAGTRYVNLCLVGWLAAIRCEGGDLRAAVKAELASILVPVDRVGARPMGEYAMREFVEHHRPLALAAAA